MRVSSPVRFVALTAVLFAIPGIAGAQRRGGPPATALTSDSLFARIAGADQRMGLEEFTAFLKERPAAARAGELPTFADSVFKALDTDNSRWLSRAEFGGVARLVAFADSRPAAARGLAAAGARRRGAAAGPVRVAQVTDSLFTAYAGADGKMTQAQFEAFLKTRPAVAATARGAAAGAARGGAAVAGRLFTRGDANGDGVLSRDEFAAAARSLINGRGKLAPPDSTRLKRRPGR